MSSGRAVKAGLTLCLTLLVAYIISCHHNSASNFVRELASTRDSMVSTIEAQI